MPFNYQRLETTPVGTVGKKRYYPEGCLEHTKFIVEYTYYNVFIILRNVFKKVKHLRTPHKNYRRNLLQIPILIHNLLTYL